MFMEPSLMPQLIAALFALVGVGTAVAERDHPLAEHRWNDRVLLLYVPAADAPALAAFRAGLHAQRCGVTDRDLVVGEVIGERSGSLAEVGLTAERVHRLRAHHGVPLDRVATVLVGKDGGVKLDVDGVAALSLVFQRIDGMPMRRREMAERDAARCDTE
jgi:hypothetical protein